MVGTRRSQISMDMIASLFIYMLSLTLVLTTVFRTYGFLSNSNFAERASLISDRLSLLLVQSEGSSGWESDPFSATSVGFASGNNQISYDKIRAFAGLGVSEARQLLGITYDHRMKVSYLPSIMLDVQYENPKTVLQGVAPLNTFSPGVVNVTIVTYASNGTLISARIWAILSSVGYGKASRADSIDGSVSAMMVAPSGKAVEAQKMAGGGSRYRVSYEVPSGGAYILRLVALSGNDRFGDKEVTINVA